MAEHTDFRYAVELLNAEEDTEQRGPYKLPEDYTSAAVIALAKVIHTRRTKQGWRCFHCQELFTDKRLAEDHFGRDAESNPACQIKAGAERSLLRALRKAEYYANDVMQELRDETTEAARAHYAQTNRHAEQLQAAEELGYERAIAEIRANGLEPLHG
jgi:hypothetical protein